MEGRVISVRRLVALDITIHGPRFVAIEFGAGTPAMVAIGAFLVVHGPYLLGLYLIVTGMNYLPILTYTVILLRTGTAASEVAGEMSADPHYVRKYSLQQFLVLVPFAMVVLALIQLKNGRRGGVGTAVRPISGS